MIAHKLLLHRPLVGSRYEHQADSCNLTGSSGNTLLDVFVICIGSLWGSSRCTKGEDMLYSHGVFFQFYRKTQIGDIECRTCVY